MGKTLLAQEVKIKDQFVEKSTPRGMRACREAHARLARVADVEKVGEMERAGQADKVGKAYDSCKSIKQVSYKYYTSMIQHGGWKTSEGARETPIKKTW